MKSPDSDKLKAIQQGVAKQANVDAELKKMLESSQSQEEKLVAARVMVSVEKEKVTNTIKAFLEQNCYTGKMR
jgi:hypothetical protein